MDEDFIGVVGLGHVGLPYAAALAHVGFRVIGVDINEAYVKQLTTENTAYFYEPSLNETIRANKSRLRFTTDFEELDSCSCVIISVGSNTDSNGNLDMSQLDSAIQKIAPNIGAQQLLMLKSTVKPTTTEKYVPKLIKSLTGKIPGQDYLLCYSPERTIEGLALHEIYTLPKIIGGIDKESVNAGARVLGRLGGSVIRVSSSAVAETCKLMDNLYRSVNIALANELGSLCERLEIDSSEVVSAVNNAYSRTRIFSPGLGADGPCLTKDPIIFSLTARDCGMEPTVTSAVIRANEQATLRVGEIIVDFLNRYHIPQPKVALLGLSFKGFPENDDIRGSPAVKILEYLKQHYERCSFSFYDPLIRSFGGSKVAESVYESIHSANIVAFLTNHLQLSNLAVQDIVEKAGSPLLIVDSWHNTIGDTRNSNVTLFRIGSGSAAIGRQ